MNPIVVHLPPEVCGALSLAQHYLDASKRGRYYPLGKYNTRQRRLREKIQKLVARAAKLMANRGVPCP
jgi:hypothetical protein